jgi:hypothetical protein
MLGKESPGSDHTVRCSSEEVFSIPHTRNAGKHQKLSCSAYRRVSELRSVSPNQ